MLLLVLSDVLLHDHPNESYRSPWELPHRTVTPDRAASAVIPPWRAGGTCHSRLRPGRDGSAEAITEIEANFRSA